MKIFLVLPKTLFISLLLLIQLGCSESTSNKVSDLPSGYYIIEKVEVDIKNSTKPPPQKMLTDLQKIKDNYYFYWDKTTQKLDYYELTLAHSVDINVEKQQMALFGEEYDVVGVDKKTFLISTNGCLWWECKITLRLHNKAENDERLKAIQKDQKVKYQQMAADLLKQKQDIEDIGFVDFIGVVFTIDDITLKLPLDNEKFLEKQNTGIYSRWFDNVHVKFLADLDNPARIYNTSARDISVIKVTAEKEDFKLSSFLKQQTRMPEMVLYKSENGAIYYSDITNYLEAFYYQYDDANKEYTFIIYQLDNKAPIDKIAYAYAVIRTIEPRYLGEQLDITAAALSPKEFEAKYADLYDINEIETQFNNELKKQLSLTHLLVKSSFTYDNEINFVLGNWEIDRNLTLKISYNTIKQQKNLDIKKMLKSSFSIAYQDEHSVIFHDDVAPDNYSTYYYQYDNGLTYRIALSYKVDSKAYLLKHLKYLNMFRLMQPVKLNMYEPNVLQSIYSYKNIKKISLPDEPDIYEVEREGKDWLDKFYGVVDDRGRVVIPTKYRKIIPIKRGYITEDDKKQYRIFNLEGQQVTKAIYDKVEYLSEEGIILIAQLNKNKKYRFGIMSLDYQQLIPMEYTDYSIGQRLILYKGDKGYELKLKGSPVNEIELISN